MSDYKDLKMMAEASVGFSDISLAPDVVLDLIAENERLRFGMKGNYDLDAWLDWGRETDALRKDAERYRWLRSREACASPGAATPDFPVIAELSDLYFTDIFTGSRADEAVDAAIAKEAK